MRRVTARTFACALLLALHVTLFATTAWSIVSPLLFTLGHLRSIWLPAFNMPFQTYSQEAWGLPWASMLSSFSQPPGFSTMPPQRPLWLERVIANSRIPDAPKMFHVKDKVVRRVDPSTSTQWFGELDAWAANIAFSGLTLFAETAIKLDSRGRVLPIAGHDVAGILDNIPLQREVLRLLKMSCPRLDMPSLDFITSTIFTPDEEIARQFRGLAQALDKIFYILGVASRPEGSISVFPDAFAATHGDLVLVGGGYQPLAALMVISLIKDKVHKDPSGSAYEMTQQLHSYISGTPKSADFSIFQLPNILDETMRKYYAIVTKDRDSKPTLNRDVQDKICQVFVNACNKATSSDNACLQFAAERIKKAALDVPLHPEFADFRSTMDLILTTHLPTAEERRIAEEDSEPTLGKRKRVDSSEATALQAFARTFTKADMEEFFAGLAAKQQQGKAAGGSKTRFNVSLAGGPPRKKRPRHKDYMCTNCTELGHDAADCTNSKHPQADKLVQEHIKRKRENQIKREQRNQARARNASQ